MAILEKATAGDPSARYANLTALAADLRRFLAGEPVAARPVVSLHFVESVDARCVGGVGQYAIGAI